MSREEDKELLSNLIFANKKFSENLAELKSLDGIAKRAEILTSINTETILAKMDGLNYTQIARKITSDIREELQKTRLDLIKSSEGASEAAKELSQKTQLLKESSDSLLQIDNMSDSLEELVKSVKQWKMRNIYAAISLSLLFGIASGSIVTTIITPTVSNDNKIIKNAELLAPFGEVAVLQNDKNKNIYYFAFAGKIKKVESIEQNGVFYIQFEAAR